MAAIMPSRKRGPALLVGALTVVAAGRAAAQATCERPVATGTFFEIAETIECNPGGASDPLLDPFCLDQVAHGLGSRLADARLEGTMEGPDGLDGAAVVTASSVLSQVDWTGPAHGEILVDGSRLVFSGQLDLSLAQAGAPFAPISGKWHGTAGTKERGTFSGTFFIPFACPPESGLQGVCYVTLDEGGQLTGFVEAEVRNGVPLVRLDVTFCGR